MSECSFLEQPGGIPWGDPLGVSPGVCRQGGSLGEIVSFRPCLSASEAALVNEAMWRIQFLPCCCSCPPFCPPFCLCLLPLLCSSSCAPFCQSF